MQIVFNRNILYEMSNFIFLFFPFFFFFFFFFFYVGGGVGVGLGGGDVEILDPLFTTFWANPADVKLVIAIFYP